MSSEVISLLALDRPSHLGYARGIGGPVVTRLLLLLLPVVFVGAAAPVPEGAGKPTYYFAVTKGSTWEYTYSPGSGKAVTQTVTDVRDEGGAKVVTIGKPTPDGKTDYLETFKVAADGVWLLRSRAADWDPPVCLLRLPHKDGATWEAEVTFKDRKTRFERKDLHKFTAHGPEEVRVQAGTFSAIRVVDVDEAGGLKRKYTTWFVAGVGVVKTSSPPPTVGSPPRKWESQLKKFSPGKD